MMVNGFIYFDQFIRANVQQQATSWWRDTTQQRDKLTEINSMNLHHYLTNNLFAAIFHCAHDDVFSSR